MRVQVREITKPKAFRDGVSSGLHPRDRTAGLSQLTVKGGGGAAGAEHNGTPAVAKAPGKTASWPSLSTGQGGIPQEPRQLSTHSPAPGLAAGRKEQGPS